MKKVLFLIVALAFTSTAMAQQNTRNQMWEFDLQLGYLDGVSLDGENGSSIDTDSTTVYGLGFAYNFNSHFALGGELNWGNPDYVAKIIPDDGIGIPQNVDYEMSMFSYTLKGTFNLLKGPITPYIDLAYGRTELDSNVASGPPTTGCWWDPWWGYICSSFFDTFSTSSETLGGALGVRWDLDNGMSLKGSYGLLAIETSSNAEDAEMNFWRLDVGWRF